MDFLQFARLHGIMIESLPPVGVWKRYRTEDKPKHRNGSCKYMGTHGFVQNHASMTEVAVWKPDGVFATGTGDYQRVAQEAARQTAQGQLQAAQRAEWIIGQCVTTTHGYLASKGFPDEVANVWAKEGGPVLVIPMRVGSKVVGCQMVTEAGDKKFLSGQRTGHAEFVFANGGPHILCEGYATALSARHALRNLKRKYTLHVTFSAGNMSKVAATLPAGYVLADNDASGTGERVAREIGWPYWMSDRVGEDANDFMGRKGLFSLAQGINRVMSTKAAAVT